MYKQTAAIPRLRDKERQRNWGLKRESLPILPPASFQSWDSDFLKRRCGHHRNMLPHSGKERFQRAQAQTNL